MQERKRMYGVFRGVLPDGDIESGFREVFGLQCFMQDMCDQPGQLYELY